MAADERQIEDYLDRLKASGRSSPAGRHWDNLYRLITRDFPKENLPSFPLILGGSIASNEDKHRRLREHLFWAHAHGRLEEAFTFLDHVPAEGWNVGPFEKWSESFSWEDEE